MIDLGGFGDQLLVGAWMTVQLAAGALVVGLLLGLAGATAKLSGIAPLRWLANVYTTVIRGLPELLVVLIIYFGSSSLLTAVAGWFGHDAFVDVGAYTAGVIALGLAYGAYATEVFRGALQAIPKGQEEAARAFGMGGWLTFRRILMPQMWRIALPGLGNLFLVLLKDTSLVYVIGLQELLAKTRFAIGFTKEPFTFYLAAAFIYLGLTIVTMVILRRAERLANRGVARGAQ